MRLKLIIAGLLFAVTSVVIATPASAVGPVTRIVGPGQAFATIQSAVVASANGDIVQVQPGTYVENVIINARYISVTAPSGATIRASNSNTATVFISNVPYVAGKSTKLSGFTITAGNGPAGQGGGITVAQNASPEIFGNTITGNTSRGYGGGIAIHTNAHPIIRNNTIQSNTALSGGGGIFAANNASPVIYGNTITGNSTTGAVITNGGSSGGGIYLENVPGQPGPRSYPVVLNNTISNNTSEFAGGGIMVRTGVNVVIEGNTITGNASSYGGGIHLESTGSTAVVTSNTITGNTAIAKTKYAGSGFGGGIAIYDSTVATIKSNTISNNVSSNGGGGISIAESASATLDSNLISLNRTGESESVVGHGGGVYIANATMTALNTQFVGNRGDIGGAISLLDNSKSTIFNNTIVGNLEPTLYGGAIFVRNHSGLTATISNNIITQNQGYQIFEESSKATLKNNIITTPSSTPSANGSGVYFNYSTNGLATSAALNAAVAKATLNDDRDPAFVDFPNGNYQLTSTSPAIDLADEAGLPAVTTDFRGAIRDKTLVDVGAFEYLETPLIPQPVYRFWSDKNKGHFYTASTGERNQVASSYPPSQWRYEGLAYTAFTSPQPGTTALYRFWSSDFQGHFFTASAAEKDSVIDLYPDNVWLYEGIAYYVYAPGVTTGPAAQSRAVYRFWSPDNKHHFFTASAAESQYVQDAYPDNVWTYEGERFRVPE